MKRWLIDKSALGRITESSDAKIWVDRIEEGLVGVGTATRLEIGYSARSAADMTAIMSSYPVSDLVHEILTPAIEERAVEIPQMLAMRGHHRAASVVDILTAAIAEANRRIVLHLDKDFELIAAVTGQPVQRLAMGEAAARDGPGPEGGEPSKSR